MAELLASNEDVQAWLPVDKFPVTTGNSDKAQVEAQRLIKAFLANVFTPVTLSGWDVPANTPPIIRSIAGRLVAAYLYRESYSEDSTTVPEYAQTLYNEAIEMLGQIRAGTLIVTDASGNPLADELSIAFSAEDFWPNNTTQPPFFAVGDVWA